MAFLKEGKTNWKHILIITVLTVLVGVGILVYQYRWLPRRETRVPEIKIPERKQKGEELGETENEQLLKFSGEVIFGESVDIPFAVDGSDLTIDSILLGNERVSLELTDPTGVRINPSLADKDENIDYKKEGGEKYWFIMYTIAKPPKGEWKAHIVSPVSAGQGYLEYDLFISQKSSISFTVSPNVDKYPEGSPVTLRAYPVVGTTPLVGASIEVKIREQYTNSSQNITLMDDGLHDDDAVSDGVYGAQLESLKAGRYDVSAILTGTLPSGIPYMRQEKTHFTISPSGAKFSDTYSDAGIDKDEHGLFHKLRIQVDITFYKDGEYELTGSLSTPAGVFLSGTSILVSGRGGTHVEANLDFDVSSLVDRPSDGPVVLKNLILSDSSLDLSADYRENAYTTKSYSRLDFVGWEAKIDGPLVDRGVDTNGNGKFEYLEIKVPLKVRRAGPYTATVELETPPGGIIAKSVLSPISDFSTITAIFQFNGTIIASSAVDGPYTVGNMIVEGPVGLALMKHKIDQTAPYSYLDFEQDTVAPVSSMSQPYETTSTTFYVSWEATDPSPSAGIVNYDIQYRIGKDGVWTDWITGTILNKYPFGPDDPVIVEKGQTYYFRVRALDFARNQSLYSGGDGDTYIRVLE